MLDWSKDLLQEGPNGSTVSGMPTSLFNNVLRSHVKALEDDHGSEGKTSAMIHCRCPGGEKPDTTPEDLKATHASLLPASTYRWVQTFSEGSVDLGSCIPGLEVCSF